MITHKALVHPYPAFRVAKILEDSPFGGFSDRINGFRPGSKRDFKGAYIEVRDCRNRTQLTPHKDIKTSEKAP